MTERDEAAALFELIRHATTLDAPGVTRASYGLAESAALLHN